MLTLYFNSILESILKYMLLECPTIIIGDFNIYMLRKTSESLTLQNLAIFNWKILIGKLGIICHRIIL
jgi:hypothetical protein